MPIQPTTSGRLAELSRVATTRKPGDQEVSAACEIIRQALSAEETYVLRAGDPHFIRLCDEADPTAYEIKQKGYWLAWRRLAVNADVPAVLFDVADRLVGGGAMFAPGKPCTHVAALLPSDESNSELLIVRGPWPDGLSPEQARFVEAVRPVVAYLVGNVLDTQRRDRQEEQLSALADVAKAFTEAREGDKVLDSLATALAKASGSDWAIIRVFDDALTAVVDRAMNLARYGETETAAMMRSGPIADAFDKDMLARAAETARTGQPFLVPDVGGPEYAGKPAQKAYLERAHLLSTATFPVMFQGRLLGMVNFSWSTKREFDPPEVDYIAALVSQAATAIQGLRLYRDLDASKEELRRYADKLEEASRVEHLLARTDPLTGLPNRRYIEEAMEAECARAGRYDQPFSLAVADLDHLKKINDGYDHLTGDEALKFVAGVSRQACRRADLVGRWGGDEFVFILPLTPLEEAKRSAERYRRLLADTPFAHPNLPEPARLTICLGVAQAGPDTFDNVALLFERADRAMYAAKEAGRNRTMVAEGDSARAA